MIVPAVAKTCIAAALTVSVLTCLNAQAVICKPNGCEWSVVHDLPGDFTAQEIAIALSTAGWSVIEQSDRIATLTKALPPAYLAFGLREKDIPNIAESPLIVSVKIEVRQGRYRATLTNANTYQSSLEGFTIAMANSDLEAIKNFELLSHPLQYWVLRYGGKGKKKRAKVNNWMSYLSEYLTHETLINTAPKDNSW